MLKAVIFDMDGVIIDSEPMHLKINKNLFKKLNMKVTEQEYNSKFIGVSNTDMWTFFKEKYKLKNTVPELVKMQVDATIKKIKEGKEKPIPGVVNLLQNLKENNIYIGLASSSAVEYIKLVLKIFKIKKYFQAVVSGENVKRGKPAPDIFLEVARQLKVKPKECVVIEDATKGIIAAKAAKMKCIGFKNKNSKGQNLSRADLVIGKFEKLNIDILKELCLTK